MEIIFFFLGFNLSDNLEFFIYNFAFYYSDFLSVFTFFILSDDYVDVKMKYFYEDLIVSFFFGFGDNNEDFLSSVIFLFLDFGESKVGVKLN